MTATRWWVKSAARWLARIDGVKGQVQMFSLAVTAFSTFSIMLQGFGLGEYVPYIGVAAAVGGAAYTWAYTEGGVWNQVSRDRNDLSDNFAAPGMAMGMTLQGRQRAVIAEAIQEDYDRERIRERMDEETAALLQEFRDGIDVEDVFENGQLPRGD